MGRQLLMSFGDREFWPEQFEHYADFPPLFPFPGPPGIDLASLPSVSAAMECASPAWATLVLDWGRNKR